MSNSTLNLNKVYNKNSGIVNKAVAEHHDGALFSDYKDTEANSANSHSINAKKHEITVLRANTLHKTFPPGALYSKRGCDCSYCCAIGELKALVGAGGSEVSVSGDIKLDSKGELREFYSDMRKRGTYVGLGDEAHMCGSHAQLCECDNGHLTAKRIYDNREWCPRCGKKGSEAHVRRVMRSVDRVYSMSERGLKVGYAVFEIHTSLRGYFESSEALRKARSYLRELLKRELPGINGLSRWHYYGDKLVEVDSEGKVVKITEGDTSCTHYKPHLNLLHSYGFIPKAKLRRIRSLWSKWQFKACGKRYYKIATVYNKFTRAEGKVWHWLRYINRSSFVTLHDGNRHIARELFKFNNCCWLGKFSIADKERGRERFEAWRATLPERELVYDYDIEAHERFDSGHCAVCGSITHNEGVVTLEDYEIIHDYGAGLYQVADIWAQALLTAQIGLELRIRGSPGEGEVRYG